MQGHLNYARYTMITLNGKEVLAEGPSPATLATPQHCRLLSLHHQNQHTSSALTNLLEKTNAEFAV